VSALPIICANGLTKTFGDFTAVDRLDFAVRPGSIYAFLGANGSGKSTTIRMLIGLLRPTAGEVVVDGIDVARFPRRVRDHVGYMSQRVSLYSTLTLHENLEFYAGLYGLAGNELTTRWDALASRFDLRSAAAERAADLPAGIRQRAGLAFSMLHRPRVLFLDEPTAGVDVQNRLLFWDIIQEEAADGVTVFVTTHFLEEVEYCDWACFIDAGRLIANGEPEHIRERYSEGYRIRIALDPADRAATLAALSPLALRAATTDAGVELHAPTLTPALTTALGACCAPHGPGRLRIERPDMTAVFRRVMADGPGAPPTAAPPVATVQASTPNPSAAPAAARWRRLRTLMQREVRATLRERSTMVMLVTVPLAALVTFGSIISPEVQNLPLALHDASRSPESRRLTADLGATGTFRVRTLPTRAALDRALVAGSVSLAVVIPPDFGRTVGAAAGAGPPPEIQVLYDGAETVLAGNAEAALQSIVAATGARLRFVDRHRSIPDLRGAPPRRGPRVVARALFNPDLDGVPFMVAGTFGFVLTFLTTLITAVSVVNERITGTFEQLQITPATSAEIVLGKILPLGAVFAADVALMVVMGGVFLDVWPAGNVALFLLVSSFYVLISLALGLIVSATSATAAAAVQKTVLFSIPLIFLGGFIFPVRSMPLGFRWMAELFPATHYIRISRAIYLRGEGALLLAPEFAIITVIGLVLMAIAFRTMESRA
jgi:ABC-type multidrug transport system ATPase subunit/ABC-type multidrug transport system permease subunit